MVYLIIGTSEQLQLEQISGMYYLQRLIGLISRKLFQSQFVGYREEVQNFYFESKEYELYCVRSVAYQECVDLCDEWILIQNFVSFLNSGGRFRDDLSKNEQILANQESES